MDGVTKKHYLFGYPISHSASPALHNSVWKEVDPSRHYALCDTYDVSQPHFKKMVREDPAFAGAAVTMPLKVTVTSPEAGILDDLTPAARAIGAVNTIVVESDPSRPNGRRFIGTNSDTLGVRNSLLRALAISAGLPETAYVSPASGEPSAFAPNCYASFIIGGGGTTRASIYALNALNLSPIYLINRDPEETAAMVAAFPTVDLRPLHSLADWERERLAPGAREIPIAVGCIPAVEPQTDGEKMVYQLAHRFLDARYKAAAATVANGAADEEGIQPPQKRHFLEMAYKPRRTPMLIRAEQAGWTSVEGVQAMIEQGFAQDRMWLLNDSSMSVACLTGEGAPIPPELEAKVRNLIATMGDVKVEKKEEWGGKPDLPTQQH